jgi:hypothetical protein
MKPFLASSLFAAGALFLSAGSGEAAESVDLTPKWLLGKRYFQSMEMAQSSTVSIGAQKMEQQMTMKTETVMTVSPHEDGQRKRLNVKYGRMAMEMNMGGQKMGFDSDSPGGTDPLGLGKTLGGLVGKEFRVILKPDGKVDDIENLDQILGELAAAGPLAGQMSQMFSKETMGQMIEQAAFRNIPPHPVKPGETWPMDFQMTLPQIGRITIKGTYRYQTMVDRDGVACAEVVNDGTLGMDIDPGLVGEGAQKLGMRFEGGKLSGTTWFDPAIGMAREGVISQEMTLKMANPANAGESVEVPITQKVAVKLTRIEDVE